jgi:predicted dehydrogenase
MNIGLIGYGYWGPNLARNFSANPDLDLAYICDFSQKRLKVASDSFKQAKLVTDPLVLVKDTDLDAVAIATPVSTHFELAKKALENGLHVWLEKPMTAKVEEAEELIELAEKRGRILHVDHTFVYTGAVQKIKELFEKGELGDLIYYDSTRVNLGLFQQDVDVIWDLAPHDISIMNHLMPLKKLAVSATGSAFYGNGIVPKALLTVYMDNNTLGHINVSWVSPVKIRQTLIGGTSKMVLYDDNQPSEKIKVYDSGVSLYETNEELYHLKVQYRVGDMWAPKVSDHEALSLATQHFVDCITNGQPSLTDGFAGLEVVKILVASQKSMRRRGVPVELA